MSILYITEEHATLFKNGNQIGIRKGKESLREVGLEKVEGIVLVGNMMVTSPLITDLLERDIPVTWLSGTGKFYGRLESTSGINIHRQREQFRRADDKEFCLALAKKFINAKIKNCQVLLRRYNTERRIIAVEDVIRELKMYLEKVALAKDLEMLLGYEGIASKKYFEGLSKLTTEEFPFSKRTRIPPKDRFNSILSLGYTLLMYEFYTAIVNKGLNAYASFLHQIRRGHPALASDLMEEWRAVIIDSLVMNIVQRRMLTRESFQPTDEKTGGVYLRRESVKVFIKKFEERLRQENKYLDYIDYSLSFRESIQMQVGSLVKAIEENDVDIYRAVMIR